MGAGSHRPLPSLTSRRQDKIRDAVTKTLTVGFFDNLLIRCRLRLQDHSLSRQHCKIHLGLVFLEERVQMQGMTERVVAKALMITSSTADHF